MLTGATMALYGWRYWRPVERRCADPEAAQMAVLRELLSRNENTQFGREHGFAGIRSLADFQARVPVQEYESLRPYVEAQRRTGARALTAEPPLFYAQTSGSTGVPKLIPVTPTALTLHRQEQALFSFLQHHACPPAFAGKALGIMGAAVEDRLDTGHAVGSVSGHLYQSLPRIVQSRFVVPPAVSALADYELKYLVILQLALAMPDVSYLGAPNPSTFLRLTGLLNEHRELLIDGLASGRSVLLDRLPPQIRSAVHARLRPDAERARRLRAEPHLAFANVWPGIRLVTTWTGGSCGIALTSVRAGLPASTAVMELGYQATEFRGTVAIEPETSAGLPVLHHHFFEFAIPEEWDGGTRRFLPLSDLQDGQQYYVAVSTASGLYRYFMNDLVEVAGRLHRTPMLRFVQKGKGVTSLTGEKLYESQVIRAVQESAGALDVALPFFLVTAVEEPGQYLLFAESRDGRCSADALSAAVDRRLGALNIEYQSKRDSGRLRPLKAMWLKPGASVAYKEACVRAGQREGQFKPVILQYRRSLAWDVDTWTER